MSRNAELLATLALAASLANPAQSETLDELRGDISGREVSISGHIGTGLDWGDDEALHFRDTAGHVYPVVFDAGRDARRSLEGCEFKMFGGTPCAMSGMAEIELDGSRIRLIVYRVDEIAPPAEI